MAERAVAGDAGAVGAGAAAAGVASNSDASCETAELVGSSVAFAAGGRPAKRRKQAAGAGDLAEAGAGGARKRRRKQEGGDAGGSDAIPAATVAGSDKGSSEAEQGAGAGVSRSTGRGAGGMKKRRREAQQASAEPPSSSACVSAPGKEPRSAVPEDGRAPATAFVRTPRAGWWGAAQFVSAGCLEGLEAQAAARERRAFDEDDQAGLYLAAHATKTANKKGLGARALLSAPL